MNDGHDASACSVLFKKHYTRNHGNKRRAMRERPCGNRQSVMRFKTLTYSVAKIFEAAVQHDINTPQ